MKILAFESSCDETSVAVVEDGKKILSNIISTQIDIHKEFGGVVPEIASRHHIENILPVFTEALEKASCKLSDIDYIAVTNTPGLIGSLLVGLMFAKSLSYANNIPLIPVNHINGHIFSSFIDNDVKLPAISLVVSGGHTNLYYIYEENGKIITDLLGETLDDAVGETYDKIARILGLEYPGGPHIDRLSVNGKDILKIKKPKVDGYNFSFSDIAKSLQEIIVNVLYDKILMAVKEKDVKTILVAGGVSANRRLREKFSEFTNLKTDENEQIQVHFPKMEYCTDNAAMIGVAAYYGLKNNSQINLEKQYDVDAISTKLEK